MDAKELVGTVVGALALLLVVGLALMCVHQVWAAAAGRRTEGMDEEYESRACARCGYDLRASGDRCPECGIVQTDHRRYLRALADDWPDAPVNPVPPHLGDPMVTLLSTLDVWEAERVVEQLLVRGVWATAAEKREEEVVGAIARTTTYHRVHVPESERERADAILDRFRGPEE